MVVADVGAGSGYFTFRIAKEVGRPGKVLAVDIQPEMLDYLRKRSEELKVDNVEPVLGTETDPKLPASRVDLILLVDVYHEFAFPYEMTEAMVEVPQARAASSCSSSTVPRTTGCRSSRCTR